LAEKVLIAGYENILQDMTIDQKLTGLPIEA